MCQALTSPVTSIQFDHSHAILNGCRIWIANKEGMPPYGPAIPHPAVFERNALFREFFFTKCECEYVNIVDMFSVINAERAALHGCPNFRNKSISVRRTNLENIYKNFGKK
jgi:hypothetical protein